jgi:hypothetical protein
MFTFSQSINGRSYRSNAATSSYLYTIKFSSGIFTYSIQGHKSRVSQSRLLI